MLTELPSLAAIRLLSGVNSWGGSDLIHGSDVVSIQSIQWLREFATLCPKLPSTTSIIHKTLAEIFLRGELYGPYQ
jgi:hypothetical protein